MGRLRAAEEFARQHFDERGVDFDEPISKLAAEVLDRSKDEKLDEGEASDQEALGALHITRQ